MPARPKQQHYVTRAYLAGFLSSQSEALFCYGRYKSKPFGQKPEELAKQRNYYSSRRPDGTWDDELESFIQKEIEDPGLDVLRSIASGKTRVTREERRRLSLLIASQRFRVPHLRKMVDAHFKESISDLLSKFEVREKETGADAGAMVVTTYSPANPAKRSETTVTKDELKLQLQRYNADPEEFSRESFMDFALSFARVFETMKWMVCYTAPGTPFITSDCPVVMTFDRRDLETVALVRPDCRIVFPLSSTALLQMQHDLRLISKLNKIGPNSRGKKMFNRIPEIGIRNLSMEEVRKYNELITDHASHWVFSGRQADWLAERLLLPSKGPRHKLVKISENLTYGTTVLGN